MPRHLTWGGASPRIEILHSSLQSYLNPSTFQALSLPRLLVVTYRAARIFESQSPYPAGDCLLCGPSSVMAAATMGSASPISSPRLPSPPPFPEVQLGPKSPGMPATSSAGIPEIEINAKLDQGAMRRIRPGTKAADFAGPPLVPLSDVCWMTFDMTASWLPAISLTS